MSALGPAACGCNSVACDFPLTAITLAYGWKIRGAKRGSVADSAAGDGKSC